MKTGRLFRRKFLGLLGSVPFLSKLSIHETAAETTVPYVESEDDIVSIGNEHFELQIIKHNGGIKQFYLKQPEVELLSKNPLPQELWSVDFYTEEYRRLRSSSWRSDPPSITTHKQDGTAFVELKWVNPSLQSSEGELDSSFNGEIHATISVTSGNKDAKWNIEVLNNDDRSVKEVLYPRVNNIEPLTEDGSDALYIPRRLGRKISNPTKYEALPTNRYPSGFGTMQFVTYTDGQHGVYAAAEDANGYAKRLVFDSSEDDTLQFTAHHLVPFRPGENVELPYDMSFGVQYGGWKDACDRYRNWVATEGWLSNSVPSVPDHIRERGVSFHGRSYVRSETGFSDEGLSFEQTQQVVSNLRDRLDVPMDFRWWGWEKYGRPAGGDWLPPKEGRDQFEDVISNLKEENVQITGFLNPTLVFDGSDYWTDIDNTDQYLVTNRNRSPEKMTDGHTEMTFFRMEPTYQEWRNHYQPVYKELVNAGVKEIDLDGFPWKWVPSCWNENHDHPVGKGGNWHPQRMRGILRELHDTLPTDDELAIGAEGIADFYLPYLNVHVIRDAGVEVMDDPPIDMDIVPMFPYTFGDYAETKSLRGHIGTFADQRNIQRLIAGRSIEWGSLPMFMGRYEPLPGDYDDAVLDYYSRIGKARANYANRFLARGEMLDCPIIDRQDVTIKQRDTTVKTNEIRGRGWRSPDGELGIVLTNVSNRSTSREIKLNLSDQPYELPADPVLYIVQNSEYRSVEGLQATVQIDPSDVVLLAAIPSGTDVKEALTRIEQAQAVENVHHGLLKTAKRAFDASNYSEAIKKAQEATEKGEDEQGEDSESEDQGDDAEVEGSVEESPGFGIVESITAIGGTVYLIKRRLTTNNED